MLLLWQEMLRLIQVNVDLVQHACVVGNVLFFDHSLKSGADLLGESVDTLALELDILHIYLVDLFFYQFELFIQAGLFRLDLFSFPLSLSDLLRNSDLNLIFKVFFLHIKFGLLSLGVANLNFNRRFLLLNMISDESIRLFGGLKSIQLFNQLLRPDFHLQLDNLSLQFRIFRVRCLNRSLRAHFGVFKLLFYGDERLHGLKIALFLLALDKLCGKLFL